MEPLLRDLAAAGLQFAAYADDLLILAKGNSRAIIENTAQAAVDIVGQWATRSHLRISSAKTILATLKGNFRNRPPTVLLQGEALRLKPVFRYLGVTYGAGMRIDPHIKYLKQRTTKVMGQLTRAAHSLWGLRYPLMQLYYNSIFVPMVTYAAAAWATLDKTHTQQIQALQRTTLIRAAKAYSTSSTEALQIVTGSLPLDLHLQLAKRLYQYRKQ